jgi:HK97 family phage major capsid protein
MDDTRRSVAAMLRDHYAELAGTAEKPAPKFSLSRVFAELCEERGLHDGYERQVCESAALIAGGRHDVHRALIPWAAIARRDLTVGADSAGGFLKGTANLTAVDVLRPWSVTARAGLTILENLRENVIIPKVTTAPVGQWLPTEGTAITLEQPVLGQAALVPHIFGCVIAISRLLLLQAPNIEAFLRGQLLGAAGKAIDAAVLAGTGTEQPTGILGTPSLASESGTSFAWVNACNMMGTLADAGLDDSRVAFIAGTAARKSLQQRALATGQARFIWDNDRVANRPAYATPAMTTGLMLAGDFSNAILSLWGPGLELAVNPNDPALFKQGVVQARALIAADVTVPQIGAFVKTTTIT